MDPSKMTHHDHLDRIGNTAATAVGYLEKRWNKYYLRTEQKTVSSLLKDEINPESTVLDVGTSHGNWLPFLRQSGFATILGVELDNKRAEQARQAGYDEVYNCDARSIPRAMNSIDAAVSNDVFVHILQMEDKIAVLHEIERLLRPGGVMIFNQASATAFGFSTPHIEEYCSFLTLNELIRMVTNHSSLVIEDIKPSYYRSIGASKPSLVRQGLIFLPLGGIIISCLDYYLQRQKPIDLSDYTYLKLRKPKE